MKSKDPHNGKGLFHSVNTLLEILVNFRNLMAVKSHSLFTRRIKEKYTAPTGFDIDDVIRKAVVIMLQDCGWYFPVNTTLLQLYYFGSLPGSETSVS